MTLPLPERIARLPARRRTKRGWLRWLIGAVIVVALLAGALIDIETGGASNSSLADLCGHMSFTRHGVPCDIPLPSDATFISSEMGAIAEGFPATQWTFKTFQSVSQLSEQYSAGLGAEGWSCIQVGPLAGFQLAVVGIDKPDRPDTTLEIVLEGYGAGEYKLVVDLIQTALPVGFSC